MTALTQQEVDSILAELAHHIDTTEHMTEMGISIYKALFSAHPEYINHFSKLKGLTKDNVANSEGIRHYGRTLSEELIRMLKTAANKAGLEERITQSGKDHKSRPVTRTQFVDATPIFIKYFQSILTKPENKIAIEKFFNHLMPAIAENM